MPPKKVIPDEVYVISSIVRDDNPELDGLQPAEVYTTLAAANAAARKMMIRHAEACNPYGDLDEFEFRHEEKADGCYYGELEGGPHGHVTAEVKVSRAILKQAEADKSATTSAKGRVKKEIKSEPKDDEDEKEEDDDDDAEEEETAPKPTKGKKGPPKTAINAKTHRKTIPQGEPDCLAGLKLLFTGTFETMDRKTSIATAIKYGAEVITKLEDTDYIVIGTRAGPAKLKKINELELETISEEEFFQILEHGIPEEKKQRMENRRFADEEEGPEESDEDEKPKKRAAAAKAKAAPAKKRARR
ncbi:hypothetical protein PFICI_04798 [Pestalotiopsis fici W106-1]|uniref:BRCT domain-containing protein n=1 Tax=Pestalotiopsis fici (strain W106-1 / CGMCC3.15140) TaxID=1229662 RepID=W3XBW4_PESFW|nr:uncharacterized protein PFICI_04798 [Pestalotiopsis fici W106-1]ETS82922.1 hypothetical protein PFICI_04798 [Pestalotiopsis fici W106-1]